VVGTFGRIDRTRACEGEGGRVCLHSVGKHTIYTQSLGMSSDLRLLDHEHARTHALTREHTDTDRDRDRDRDTDRDRDRDRDADDSIGLDSPESYSEGNRKNGDQLAQNKNWKFACLLLPT
jgi:hypothetical protein